jgi:cell division protein FtsN
VVEAEAAQAMTARIGGIIAALLVVVAALALTGVSATHDRIPAPSVGKGKGKPVLPKPPPSCYWQWFGNVRLCIRPRP